MSPRHLAWVGAGLSLAGTLSLLVETAVGPQGWQLRRTLAEDLVLQEADNAALAARIDGMQRRIEALGGNSRTQEHVVRDALGWVRPGELVVHLGDEPPAAAAPPGP